MAPAGKQVGQLGLLAAAFLAGRWTHSVGTGSPQAELSDVAPEERHLLYTPPPGHGAVEVSTTTTSVLRDARGEIHNLRIGAARFNVLASLAGAMRSGDVHRSRQLDMVFSGLCTVTTREAGRDVRRTYGAGSLIELPAHVPHAFEFLNDTVTAEWWPDAAAFEARYYRPYRAKVDRAYAAMEGVASGKQGRGASHPKQAHPTRRKRTPPEGRRAASQRLV